MRSQVTGYGSKFSLLLNDISLIAKRYQSSKCQGIGSGSKVGSLLKYIQAITKKTNHWVLVKSLFTGKGYLNSNLEYMSLTVAQKQVHC